MQLQTEYSKAIVRKYPEQVVIALAKDPQGKYNPITLGWTMITSGNPPMMAVAIGFGRYSVEAIQTARSFTIALPSRSMAEETLFHGTKSGRTTDKLKEAGTLVEPATEIDSVIMVNAVANFECLLESEMVTGDHMLFVGKIVASHMNSDPGVQRLYTVGKGHSMGAVERL